MSYTAVVMTIYTLLVILSIMAWVRGLPFRHLSENDMRIFRSQSVALVVSFTIWALLLCYLDNTTATP